MLSNIDIQKGMSFDSSLSNIDESISDNEYIERLVSLLQPILNTRFPGNIAKQRIRIHKDRINFCCPLCGDSMKNNYKKRGNFILIGKYSHFFKCFNCGIAKRIDHFFADYKINLDLNIINYISKGIHDFSSHTNIKYDMSLFLDMESIEKFAIDRQEFLKYFNLVEIKDSPVRSWLKNRMQYDFEKFMYNSRLDHLVILNLTHTGKILGIQKRPFKKGQSKYLTYTLQKIYELMKRNPKDVPDEINMLSQLFGICLLDYSKPIILTEGPLDSFLISNSIANAGANKQFPFDISLKYLYDKDETGIKKSIEHINNEDAVFLWEKFLKDINAPYRKKWDINDIFIWAKENNIKIPNILNYFSNDKLDIIDI
jgi:hypothetical protein